MTVLYLNYVLKENMAVDSVVYAVKHLSTGAGEKKAPKSEYIRARCFGIALPVKLIAWVV
jgi:hypothetical protein